MKALFIFQNGLREAAQLICHRRIITDYNNLRKSVVICVICGALFSACERRELTYYMESEITVTADWGGTDLAEECDYGATLVIYSHDGTAPRTILMGERGQTTIRLPEGVYDAVLFNRSFEDFGCVSFRGHETLETFEAYACEVETRVGTRTIVSPPEKLAAATVRGFVVTEDMLGNYAPPLSRTSTCPDGACKLHFVPAPLTRKVNVVLHVEGIHNVREARCTLSNVPLSIFLHNGSVGGEKCHQEFTVGNPVLDEGSWQNGTMTGEINVFGFDKDIPHEIKLKALLVDGQTVEEKTLENVTINESKDDSGVMTLFITGETPEAFPDVKPDGGSGSGFDADVKEWDDEVRTEIPVN